MVLFAPFVCRAQNQDSIKIIMLPEVAIKANRYLYKISADAFIYDVSSDSSLIGKNSFEALRNTPLLNVERNGTVRSIGGWSIEYLVNGAHDHSLSGNIQDALQTLDAKYLKRIEVRIIRNVKGEEMLQINFVTKGRLLGYRGIVSSALSDDSWRNGTYLYAKRNRVGMSFSYYNTWTWGHENRKKSEEWRYNLENLYYTNRVTKESGYKVDLNNMEMNLSYEITPLKVFSIFVRALLKINPHNNSTTDCCVENRALLQTYRYRYEQDYKADKDAEYQVSFDYEHLFGENAQRGKFYAGYEFYARPVKTHTDGVYSLLEYLEPSYIKDFYDFNEQTARHENWHTVTVLYRRKFKSHQLFAEDFIRYRDEANDVSQKQSYNYGINPYDKIDRSQYKHQQFANGLKLGYSYTTNKISTQAGVNYLFIRDSSEEPLLQNSFTSNQQFVTPYADFSYSANGKASARLSYSMAKQVPDIRALNPYVYTNVPGHISYGNPNLKPQTSQLLSLSSNFRIGKFNFYASSTHSFTKDLILQHSFLDGRTLHITMNNIGKRYENATKVTVSSKLTSTTWTQVETNLYYTNYAYNAYYKRNRGCTFSTNAYLEQQLPHDFDISVSGGYNTPYIYMQGKGGENFYYKLRLDKSFPKSHITVSAEANSFLPLHYVDTRTNNSMDYYCVTQNRGFHASFLLSLRWRFGKLKADERKVDERFKHEDIKRNYDE